MIRFLFALSCLVALVALYYVLVQPDEGVMPIARGNPPATAGVW